MSTLFVMYLLTRISHLCWSGYLYLRTSDFRNIELRKSINHTIVDPPPHYEISYQPLPINKVFYIGVMIGE